MKILEKILKKLFGEKYKYFTCWLYYKENEKIKAFRLIMRADNILECVLSGYDERSQYVAIKKELDIMCKVAKRYTGLDWQYYVDDVIVCKNGFLNFADKYEDFIYVDIEKFA